MPEPKSVSDYFHPIHERAFDHLKRAAKQLTGFFGIFLGKVSDSFDQSMGKAPPTGWFLQERSGPSDFCGQIGP